MHCSLIKKKQKLNDMSTEFKKKDKHVVTVQCICLRELIETNLTIFRLKAL